MRSVKFISIVALAGILAALYLSKDPKEQMLQKIRKGRIDNTLGSAKLETQRELEFICNRFLNKVFQNQSFVVNEFKEGKISVLTYDSNSNHYFNFGRGNAIYDPLSDVIFIDQSIVSVNEILDVNSTTSDVFLTMYTTFLLLHEIGHRELHSVNSSKTIEFAFQSYVSDKMLSKEEEADIFALSQLLNIYQDTEYSDFLDSTGFDSSDFVGLDRSKYQGAEKLYSDFAGIMKVIAKIYFIGNTEFTPFYTDSSHPTLITRIENLLQSKFFDQHLSEPLKAHLATSLEWFYRFRYSGTLPRFEIFCPFPIASVGIAGSKTIFIGSDYYSEIDVDMLREPLENTKKTLTAKKETPETIRSIFENSISHTFLDEYLGWIVYDFKQNTATEVYTGKIIPAPSTDISSVYIPPQPNPSLYLHGGQGLFYWQSGWQLLDIDSLIGRNALLPDSAVTYMTNQLGSELFFTITAKDFSYSKLIGYFSLDMTSRSVHTLKIFDDPISIGSEIVRFAHFNGTPHAVLIDDDGSQTISLIQNDTKLDKMRILLHDNTLRTASKELWYQYPSIWGMDVAATEKGRLYISYIEDSIYEIDLEKMSINVAFHPSTTIQILSNGRFLILPELNSYTAYLVDGSTRNYPATLALEN
jgi:hypothetical protein